MLRLARKLAVPLLCTALGVAGGVALARRPAHVAAPAPLRERGYRFVNPLLACESGADVLQDEDLRPFRDEVEAAVRRVRAPGLEAVSVYFRELNDGVGFSLGESERFVPASLRKLPLMIAILKLAERDPALLERTLVFDLANDHSLVQHYRPAVSLVRGEAYTVRELIRRMIVYSDNNAFMELAAHLDPRDLDRTYEELDLARLRRGEDGHYLPAETFASLFRVLYNANYVGKDLSEWALALLAQSDFRGGIVRGVAEGVPVAHKFGESRDERGRLELHDCGIVYDPQHPYVLCVMTRGSSFEHLDDAIAALAQAVHAEVARQARRPPR